MKKNLIIFISFILIFVISACNAPSPTETPISNPGITEIVENPDGEAAYPAPETNEEVPAEEMFPTAAYPVETEEYVEDKIVIPTPDTDFGVVHGVVNSLSIDDKVIYSNVYLASKIPVDPGDDYLISVQENSSPHSQTNNKGEFVISEIPPGDYILVLVTPANTFPVLTEDGEQIDITIEGGELIDLGEIFVNWPNF